MLDRAEREPLEAEVLKRTDYPDRLNFDVVAKWSEGIPTHSINENKDPEWTPTPMITLDLEQYGYGIVHIKNEADQQSNTTGTIKDRAAWEMAKLYRDFARALDMKTAVGRMQRSDIEGMPMPRFSLVTSGNEGVALANCFEKYQLPPPKLIVDAKLAQTHRALLTALYADIYSFDLSSQQLTAADIKSISENDNGPDITSLKSIEPQAVFYDQHVHEVFNEEPDEVYLPYGSGRLMENYLYWQARTIRNAVKGVPDPRLKVHPGKVIAMDVFGAEPKGAQSIADKLTAPFKPFTIFQDQDVQGLIDLSFTGKSTRKHPVNDERIIEAYIFLQKAGIPTEPSAAAGLGLYLDRFERGLVQKHKKIVVVNTGRGFIAS